MVDELTTVSAMNGEKSSFFYYLRKACENNKH